MVAKARYITRCNLLRRGGKADETRFLAGAGIDIRQALGLVETMREKQLLETSLGKCRGKSTQ